MPFKPTTKEEVVNTFRTNANLLIQSKYESISDFYKKTEVGIHDTYLYATLSGNRSMGFGPMIAIANALEVELAELISESSDLARKAKEAKRERLLAELAELDK